MLTRKLRRYSKQHYKNLTYDKPAVDSTSTTESRATLAVVFFCFLYFLICFLILYSFIIIIFLFIFSCYLIIILLYSHFIIFILNLSFLHQLAFVMEIIRKKLTCTDEVILRDPEQLEKWDGLLSLTL